VLIGETAAAGGRTADPYKDTDVIDERAPRFNQSVVALVTALAVLTGEWWLAGVMGLQLAVGLTFGRRFCLPCVLYFEVVQPIVGEGEIEDARPPRFANILGATFLLAAAGAHLIGWSAVGWTLIAMVAILATLAAVTGFCTGCTVYRVVAQMRGIGSRSHKQIDPSDFPAAMGDQKVVEFTHPMCTDCRKLERKLEARGLDVLTIDVTEESDLAHKYGVSVVPLAFSFDPEGRVVDRFA
jgi:hypothetical protein